MQYIFNVKIYFFFAEKWENAPSRLGESGNLTGLWAATVYCQLLEAVGKVVSYLGVLQEVRTMSCKVVRGSPELCVSTIYILQKLNKYINTRRVQP